MFDEIEEFEEVEIFEEVKVFSEDVVFYVESDDEEILEVFKSLVFDVLILEG